MKSFRAAMLSVLVVLAVVATPTAATAAPLGRVELSQSSGVVDETPMFRRAAASASCPAGFGRNALLRVGRPGGPYSNLARPLAAGGYDRAPVAANPNRSFRTALAGVPAGGQWWVVVECFSETRGQHPERFITSVTVTGTAWKLTPAGARPKTATPTPPTSGVAPVATASAAAAAAAATPSASGVDPQLVNATRSRDASPSGPNLWWLAALGAVVVVLGTTWLTRRRPVRR